MDIGGEFPLGLAASSIPSSFSGGMLFFVISFQRKKICAYLAPWDLWSQASRLSTAAQQQATHISLCLHQWSKIWTEQKYIHSVQLLLYTPTLLYTITLAYVFNAKRFTNYKSIIIHLTYVKEKDLLTPRKCIDLATLKSTSL